MSSSIPSFQAALRVAFQLLKARYRRCPSCIRGCAWPSRGRVHHQIIEFSCPTWSFRHMAPAIATTNSFRRAAMIIGYAVHHQTWTSCKRCSACDGELGVEGRCLTIAPLALSPVSSNARSDVFAFGLSEVVVPLSAAGSIAYASPCSQE